MKGGLVSVNLGTISFLDKLRELIRLQHITCVRIPANSGGGYLFRITITQPSNDFLSIYPGKQEVIFNTRELLLKLVQVGIRADDMHNGKEISLIATFNREVITQNTIYTNSMDYWFEPICPNIIYSKYFLRTDITPDMTVIRDLLNLCMFDLNTFNVPKIIGIGCIFMEMLTGTTQASVQFPNYNQHTPLVLSPTPVQNIVLKNYLYQLVRLSRLGYYHGDTHLDNAMVVNNYDYINNIRVYLIDFGRTKTIMNSNSVQLVTNEVFWSYRQMQQYLTSIGDLDLWYNNIRSNEIHRSRQHYIIKLYENHKLSQLKHLSPTHEQLRITDSDMIFKSRNIPLRVVSVPDELRLNCNTVNSDCIYKKNNKEGIVSINPQYQPYGQEEITIISSITDTYIDEQFLNFTETDGIFLWVIGIRGGTTKPKIFFIWVNSCFEFATKHSVLIQKYSITSIYGAGEMIKSNNNLTFNLLSGTYMFMPLTQRVITHEQINQLNNSVVSFAKYKLNKTQQLYTINMCIQCNQNIQLEAQVTDILNKNTCCKNNNYNLNQLNYFIKVNKIFTDISKAVPFIFNKTKAQEVEDQRLAEAQEKQKLAEAQEKQKLAEAQKLAKLQDKQRLAEAQEKQKLAEAQEKQKLAEAQKFAKLQDKQRATEAQEKQRATEAQRATEGSGQMELVGEEDGSVEEEDGSGQMELVGEEEEDGSGQIELGGGIVQSKQSLQSNNKNLQKDVNKDIINVEITINNLFMDDIDIEFSKIISNIKNINFINNIQLLNKYAEICCMNSYKNCINTILLRDSTIQENIISINPIIIDGKTSSTPTSTSTSTSKYSSTMQTIQNNAIPSNKINNELGLINSGGYIKKHKKLTNKRNIKNKRNKTVNKRHKTINKRHKPINKRHKTINKRHNYK